MYIHRVYHINHSLYINKKNALRGNRTLSSTLEGLHVTTTPLTLMTWLDLSTNKFVYRYTLPTDNSDNIYNLKGKKL
jgi:hypothetical protein